ncbi:hypothetical protein Bca101_049880 [Brassica carinata]
MRWRNHVEHVVMIGCNFEDKRYEKTDINTCSRSRKSLPQLPKECVITARETRHKFESNTWEAVGEYLKSVTGVDDEKYD